MKKRKKYKVFKRRKVFHFRHETNLPQKKQREKSKTKVTFLAKIKTTVQMSTIGTYILGLAINQNLLLVIGDISLVAATAITLYTGYQYTLNVFE